MTDRRILLLNWRDPWHPQSGGAEALTYQVLLGLRDKGYSCEWFSAAYPGASPAETRDGMLFVRGGSQMTVHLHAYARYRRNATFSAIIDQINTIPFMTPLWSRVPTIAWFNQLAREVWLYEGGMLGPLGYALEPYYLRPYRSTALITISQSSLEGLRSLGLHGEATVLPIAMPVDAIAGAPTAESIRKNDPPEIVMCGRVTPSKRIEDAIAAVKILRSRGWKGHLHIIGRGNPNYVRSLQQRAEHLVPGAVSFHGFTTNEERLQLMSTASVLWMTSVREGWGLVISEAALGCTPAVAYDIPGVRDAIVHGQTGFLCSQSPAALADATLALFHDDVVARFGQAARERALSISPGAMISSARSAIEKVLRS